MSGAERETIYGKRPASVIVHRVPFSIGEEMGRGALSGSPVAYSLTNASTW